MIHDLSLSASRNVSRENAPDSPSQPAGCTRRTFLGTTGTLTGAVILAGALPRPLRAQLGRTNDAAPPITDPRVKTLVLNGVQAARDAGAAFAEVRLSHTLIRKIAVGTLDDQQLLHASVNAFVDGAWGFASSPFWSDDDIVRLARSAVRQARDTAQAQRALAQPSAHVVPSSPSGARTGHWATPIKQDPLTVHPFEIQDFLGGLTAQIPHEASKQARERAEAAASAEFIVQERAYGASDNSYVTQRLYRTGGNLTVSLAVSTSKGVTNGARRLDAITATGCGWELFTEQPLLAAASSAFERIREARTVFVSPTIVGRYPVVIDAQSAGLLLSHTIGTLTEADRALGYGTFADEGQGWLVHPAEMLGTLRVGSPQLTVTANRSEVGGATTVQWDDEGVVPQPFSVVDGGVF